MKTWTVQPEVVRLLSQITGQPLDPLEITPMLVFTAALITVLHGVMAIDRVVASEEEQRLLAVLKTLIHGDGELYHLSRLLVNGVKGQQVYLDPNVLLTLSAPLSDSLRLLLIGFGCEMSVADGTIDIREKMYLQSVAGRLQVDRQHLATIEAGFAPEVVLTSEAWDEVQVLLAREQFQHLDSRLAKAASYIRSILPPRPN